MYVTIQRRIASREIWHGIDKGIEISGFEYQDQDWPAPRRMIAVRQKVASRPQVPGKQLSLFEEDQTS
jgi:bacillopeptidase F (M6 metalloprotease family)